MDHMGVEEVTFMRLLGFVICKTWSTGGKTAKGLNKVCLFHVGGLQQWAGANKWQNGSTQAREVRNVS